MIIAVDFDGTIFNSGSKFPYVGTLIPGAREALLLLKKLGCHIIICSARNNSILNNPVNKFLGMYFMIKALLDYDIPFDEIDFGDHGKTYADIIIDDRAIGFRGNWIDTLKEVFNHLFK